MLNTPKPWLLPSGFEDILPARAERIEAIRRQLIDLYRSWGYQLVMPPMLEHLETLLTGVGQELDLQTLKLVDQDSGRMLGMRSDMTPQVARIDAHRFHADVPNRLCYADTVLHAASDHYGGSRAPLQVGAELFGVDSAAADVEVISLMVRSLHLAGVAVTILDLGHMGIPRALMQAIPELGEWEEVFYQALRRKAGDDLRHALKAAKAEQKIQSAMLALLDLQGAIHVLDQARQGLLDSAPQVRDGIERLAAIHRGVLAHVPDLEIQFDFSDVRGYRYHTGPVFSVFSSNEGAAIAQGGRYNGIGAAFGRGGRPATGFSLDLKQLVAPQQLSQLSRIWAPAMTDPTLAAEVERLRAAGHVVVQSVRDQTDTSAEEIKNLNCGMALRHMNGQWQLEPV